MAKGTESKRIVSEKILSVFDGAFLYNDGKEIRIPLIEDGSEIQIKVTLTAAKTCVTVGEDNAVPGAAVASNAIPTQTDATQPTPPSEEEMQAVNDLLSALGL